MPVDPVVTRRFLESLSTHMEDHLATWKSNLVDARREIDTLLSSLSDKIPAHAKPLFPEDLVGIMLEDALPPPPPPERVVETVVERVVEKVVEKVMVPGPPAAPDWSAIRSAVSAIESARTQVDVLTRFLGQANAHASRVALLVLRNERLTGWKALGYDASGGRDDSIKTVDLAGEDDPFAGGVLKGERSMLAEPPDEASALRRALGGRAPTRSFIVPMVIRDRVAGLLCADELPGEEGRLNEAALEVLTFVTGLTVDLLAARKKIPSPSLTPTGELLSRLKPAVPAPPPPPMPAMPFADPGMTARAVPAKIFEPPAPPPPRVPEAPKPAAEPPPPPRPATFRESADLAGGAKPSITDAREALRALEESAVGRRVPPPRTVAPPPPPGRPPAPLPRSIPEDLGLTTAIPSPMLKAPAPPPPAAPSPAPPLMPAQGAGELTIAFEHLKTAAGGMPSPVVPPRPVPAPAPAPPPPPPLELPPAKPAAPPAGPADALMGGSAAPVAPPPGFIPRSRLRAGDDSQRAVDDAKRLARLLVSEIKLYNERKVEEGKTAGDLYERLKDDIERSRQVYEERTPEPVRKGADYFREELIRILADGRAEVFGPMP